ncbi:MAG: hypothetical protein O7A09_10500 [Proteobacteria bacterium]|nr:hypothetical protein [Pseudomonadota bacterium]MCZ6782999.1 hypothetical protein [Pseudomonadota bacterium]
MDRYGISFCIALAAVVALPYSGCDRASIAGLPDRAQAAISTALRGSAPSAPEQPAERLTALAPLATLEVDGRVFQVLVGLGEAGKPWSAAIAVED